MTLFIDYGGWRLPVCDFCLFAFGLRVRHLHRAGAHRGSGAVKYGAGRTVGLGFAGQGGTLTTPGMLLVNRCTWAHILVEVVGLLNLPLDKLQDFQEQAAMSGRMSLEGVVIQLSHREG